MFEGLSLKQIKKNFVEGESSTLSKVKILFASNQHWKKPFASESRH